MMFRTVGRSWLRSRWVETAIALAVTAASQASAQPQYYLTPIEPLAGHTWSEAYRVNRYGQVTGKSTAVDSNGQQVGSEAFLWQPDTKHDISGTLSGLGNFGGAFGGATGINRRGFIVGAGQDGSSNALHAYLWSPSPNDNDDVGSKAQLNFDFSGAGFGGINDHGAISGDTPQQAPVVWDNGTLTTLPYQGYGSGRAINNRGDVVGHMAGFGGTYQAVRWENNGGTYTYENIANDGGAAFHVPGAAAAINNNGLIGAYYQPGNGDTVGVVWDGQNITTILPSHADISNVLGLNDKDHVVGHFRYTNSEQVAFVYMSGMAFDQTLMYDLNQCIVNPHSGWVLRQAYDINEFGQIVGTGTYNGQVRGFLLTPVPSAGASATLAMAGVIAAVRRRRGG